MNNITLNKSQTVRIIPKYLDVKLASDWTRGGSNFGYGHSSLAKPKHRPIEAVRC